MDQVRLKPMQSQTARRFCCLELPRLELPRQERNGEIILPKEITPLKTFFVLILLK